MKKCVLNNSGKVTVEVAIFLPACVLMMFIYVQALYLNMFSHHTQLEKIVEASEYATGQISSIDSNNDIQVQQFKRGENTTVWDMGYMDRGVEIQGVFGRNLPKSFPVLTRFNNNTATVISSIDTTLKTYQEANSLYKAIEKEIASLAEEKDYSYKDIIITNSDVVKKQYWLVIPENELKNEQQQAIERAKNKAAQLNVEFKLIKYQTK